MDYSPHSILVVDDETVLADNLCSSFMRRGWKATCAYSGPQAVESFKTQPTEIILLDMKMPQMNGFDTMQELFKLQTEVCILFFTEYGTVKSASEAVRKGAWSMLQKGMPFDDLLAMVDNAFNQYATQRLLREEKRVAEEDAARKDAALTLANGMAHQIRNRTSAIGMALNSVIRACEDKSVDGSVRSQIDQSLQLVCDNLDLIEVATDGLRNAARIQDLSTCPVELATTLDAAIQLARRRHSNRRMKSTFDVNVPADFRVMGDREFLPNAFECVIDNAVEAMAEAGTLRIEASRNGNSGQISFIDSGPGFSNDMLTRAHQRFCSSKKETNIGMGLAFAKEVVDLCGGTFSYGNNENSCGAWVKITLPKAA